MTTCPYSIANKLCLEVPAASLRAQLLLQHFPRQVMEPSAHTLGTPHLPDGVDLLDTCRSHLTNYHNIRRRWSERSNPSCSGSCSGCLLQEVQPCAITTLLQGERDGCDAMGPLGKAAVGWMSCLGGPQTEQLWSNHNDSQSCSLATTLAMRTHIVTVLPSRCFICWSSSLVQSFRHLAWGSRHGLFAWVK